MLLNNYYTIAGERNEGGKDIYDIILNPASEIYKGHFPGMPVAPGACNIQMLTECASKVTGKELMIDAVSKCKFRSLIALQDGNLLRLEMQLEEEKQGTYTIDAKIFRDTVTCVEFKGELSCFVFL